VLGWSDPTFAHDSVAKVMLEVAPAQQEFLSMRAMKSWTKQVKKVGITYFSFVFTIFFSWRTSLVYGNNRHEVEKRDTEKIQIGREA
jgi:hypothetical protein